MRRTGLLLAATALLMVALAGAALAATIDGDQRDNRLVGTEQADTLRGLRGSDSIYGRGGEDTLSGNSGDDTVHGGDGDDSIRGGRGSDVLFMRDGLDGNDAVQCGAGIDSVRVDSREEADEAVATCESLEYRAEATGVLRVFEGDLFVYSPYYIKDEASGAFYLVYPGGRDLEPYVGRRVNVSGEVTDDAAPPSMYLERIDFAELEPAGR